MVMPAFLVVMLTVAYPIVLAVIRSFQDQKTGAFTFENYTYFFTEPAQFKNLMYTLFVVVATVAIAIVIAYLLALYLRFTKSSIAKTIGTLYLLPRFVPAMCAVYAMISLKGVGLSMQCLIHAGVMAFSVAMLVLASTFRRFRLPDSLLLYRRSQYLPLRQNPAA